MKNKKLNYEKELIKLQIELVKLQEWVKREKKKIVIIFEGRDTAGKGGVIKRIIEKLNPRVCRTVALGVPTEKEKTQWYFQRYVPYLPAGGEIVLFDRSWYNRAGVEKVMGFCTENEYNTFLHDCPLFESMLIKSGIIMIKYWFSVSDQVQEKRFIERISNPLKQWKFSKMDLKSRDLWSEYSKAKDQMFQFTHTEISPWFVVNGDKKKEARLNCIHHILDSISYIHKEVPKIKLFKIVKDGAYQRTPFEEQIFVPKIY